MKRKTDENSHVYKHNVPYTHKFDTGLPAKISLTQILSKQKENYENRS